MAFCTKCGAQVPDGSTFCTACGNPIASAAAPAQPAQPAAPEQPAQAAAPAPAPAPQQQYQQQYQQAAPNQQAQYQQQYAYQPPAPDQYDHTSEYDAKDISDNKVYAMATYMFSVLGIIIALLASRDSKYAAFHVRQAMKLEIATVLCAVCMIVPILGWIVGGIGAVIIEVLKIIAFFQVCGGKAKEPAIVRSFGFLK